MVKTKRSHHNPILLPDNSHPWEAEAAFNGSVIRDESAYSMVYRAVSLDQLFQGIRMNQSTVGLAHSGDGINFRRRQQLISPTEEWDRFGCEDPRMTKLDGTYYIMYTAISTWPPDSKGIKVAVAVTKDLNKIEEKHLVSFFNAKAAVIFPERINGKIAMLITAHTDMPPSKVCLALFDSPEEMWSEDYWRKWYADLDSHVVPIIHTPQDQIEVGAVPVKTEDGWIVVFGFVQNYFSGGDRLFRIDAALLDLTNPQKVVGQTVDPLLVPEEEYEMYGLVPNTIFPSGAMLEDGEFYIYYGACDTTVARASITLSELLEELKGNPMINPNATRRAITMERFEGNPIIAPVKDHPWETHYTFNPGAIYAGGKVHILYRAMGDDDTSVFGYASSRDGVHIDERLNDPVYVPRESFEKKHHPGFSGCEDARLTAIGDTIYMCYTAYDGVNPPRIALTTIKYEDLVNKKFDWTKPILISAPGVDNKDSCVFPEKVGDRYVIVHRITPCIWMDFVTDLNFGGNTWLGGHPLMSPRPNSWDSLKIGLGGPPDKTEDGWLMIYHGVSKYDVKYRLGACLLDLDNPFKVIGRLHNPILEPEEWYENKGYREGTVFDCGHAVIGDRLYVYYGGADQYVGVASVELKKLLNALKSGK